MAEWKEEAARVMNMLSGTDALASVFRMAKIPPTQYSVAACIVVLGSDGSASIAAAGVGTRCLGPALIRADRASVVDCHAEVLARKAFCRLVALECIWLQNQPKPARGAIIEVDAETGRLVQRPDIRLVLWISESPCGDASVGTTSREAFIPRGKRPRDEPAAVAIASPPSIPSSTHRIEKARAVHWSGAKPADLAATDAELAMQSAVLRDRRSDQVIAAAARDTTNGCVVPMSDSAAEQAHNLLRVKSGRSDLPRGLRTRSMSCSDKIARWMIVGLQGRGLADAVASLQLHGVIVSIPHTSDDIIPATTASATTASAATASATTASATTASATTASATTVSATTASATTASATTASATTASATTASATTVSATSEALPHHRQALVALNRALNLRCQHACEQLTASSNKHDALASSVLAAGRLTESSSLTSLSVGQSADKTTQSSVHLAISAWQPAETVRDAAKTRKNPLTRTEVASKRPTLSAHAVAAASGAVTSSEGVDDGGCDSLQEPMMVPRRSSWGSAIACMGMRNWPIFLAHAVIAAASDAQVEALRWSLADLIAQPCPKTPVSPPLPSAAAALPSAAVIPPSVPIAVHQRVETISAKGILLGRKPDSAAQLAAPAISPCRLDILLRAACTATRAQASVVWDAAADTETALQVLDRRWAILTGTLGDVGPAVIREPTGFERWLHCPCLEPDNGTARS